MPTTASTIPVTTHASPEIEISCSLRLDKRRAWGRSQEYLPAVFSLRSFITPNNRRAVERMTTVKKNIECQPSESISILWNEIAVWDKIASVRILITALVRELDGRVLSRLIEGKGATRISRAPCLVCSNLVDRSSAVVSPFATVAVRLAAILAAAFWSAHWAGGADKTLGQCYLSVEAQYRRLELDRRPRYPLYAWGNHDWRKRRGIAALLSLHRFS